MAVAQQIQRREAWWRKDQPQDGWIGAQIPPWDPALSVPHLQLWSVEVPPVRRRFVYPGEQQHGPSDTPAAPFDPVLLQSILSQYRSLVVPWQRARQVYPGEQQYDPLYYGASGGVTFIYNTSLLPTTLQGRYAPWVSRARVSLDIPHAQGWWPEHSTPDTGTVAAMPGVLQPGSMPWVQRAARHAWESDGFRAWVYTAADHVTAAWFPSIHGLARTSLERDVSRPKRGSFESLPGILAGPTGRQAFDAQLWSGIAQQDGSLVLRRGQSVWSGAVTMPYPLPVVQPYGIEQYPGIAQLTPVWMRGTRQLWRWAGTWEPPQYRAIVAETWPAVAQLVTPWVQRLRVPPDRDLRATWAPVWQGQVSEVWPAVAQLVTPWVQRLRVPPDRDLRATWAPVWQGQVSEVWPAVAQLVTPWVQRLRVPPDRDLRATWAPVWQGQVSEVWPAVAQLSAPWVPGPRKAVYPGEPLEGWRHAALAQQWYGGIAAQRAGYVIPGRRYGFEGQSLWHPWGFRQIADELALQRPALDQLIQAVRVVPTTLSPVVWDAPSTATGPVWGVLDGLQAQVAAVTTALHQSERYLLHQGHPFPWDGMPGPWVIIPVEAGLQVQYPAIEQLWQERRSLVVPVALRLWEAENRLQFGWLSQLYRPIGGIFLARAREQVLVARVRETAFIARGERGMNTMLKEPAEVLTRAVEFVHELQTGEALSSGTLVAIDRKDLMDVTAIVLESDTMTVNGTKGVFTVQAGTAGRDYLVTMTVTLNTENVLIENILIQVRNGL